MICRWPPLARERYSSTSRSLSLHWQISRLLMAGRSPGPGSWQRVRSTVWTLLRTLAIKAPIACRVHEPKRQPATQCAEYSRIHLVCVIHTIGFTVYGTHEFWLPFWAEQKALALEFGTADFTPNLRTTLTVHWTRCSFGAHLSVDR